MICQEPKKFATDKLQNRKLNVILPRAFGLFTMVLCERRNHGHCSSGFPGDSQLREAAQPRPGSASKILEENDQLPKTLFVEQPR